VNGGTVGRWNGNRLVFWPGNAWEGKCWAGVKLKRGPLDGSPGLDFLRGRRRFCTGFCRLQGPDRGHQAGSGGCIHHRKTGLARAVVGRKVAARLTTWNFQLICSWCVELRFVLHTSATIGTIFQQRLDGSMARWPWATVEERSSGAIP
jgi:hypothetical protein